MAMLTPSMQLRVAIKALSLYKNILNFYATIQAIIEYGTEEKVGKNILKDFEVEIGRSMKTLQIEGSFFFFLK